jgi:DNA modification methylase
MEEAPTICLEHLSSHQIRAFMLADNRLTENASWDEKLLGEQLKVLADAELDFDIELTGFEMGEIDVFIEGLTPDIKEEENEVPTDASFGSIVSRVGDLWQLGRNRVLCGNALDPAAFQALMGNAQASLVFTDPPYNVQIDGHATGLGKVHHREFAMASGEMTSSEFTDFLHRALQLLADHSVDGSIHYVCMDWRHILELLGAGSSVYEEQKNVCVWVKDNAGMGSLYRSQHELIFVFKKGDAPHHNNVQLGRMGRHRSNVWNYPGANSFSRQGEDLLSVHPTVKPVAMVTDAIMDCSSRGDIVLDSFLGSGTTLIAAERVGRICYGIELEPQYVDATVHRWQKLTGLHAVEQGTERTFAEVQEERQ